MTTQFKCQKTFLFPVIQFSQTVLFQTIQFSISIVFIHTQLNIKRVLFQTIQFSISRLLSSVLPIDRTLSSATPPGLSGSGSDGNEGVLPQSSSIITTSTSYCLGSYTGHLLAGLSFCRDAVCVFYSGSRLGSDPQRTSFILMYVTCFYVGNYSCTKEKTLLSLLILVLHEFENM